MGVARCARTRGRIYYEHNIIIVGAVPGPGVPSPRFLLAIETGPSWLEAPRPSIAAAANCERRGSSHRNYHEDPIAPERRSRCCRAACLPSSWSVRIACEFFHQRLLTEERW